MHKATQLRLCAKDLTDLAKLQAFEQAQAQLSLEMRAC
jgi:hypothetical protein